MLAPSPTERRAAEPCRREEAEPALVHAERPSAMADSPIAIDVMGLPLRRLTMDQLIDGLVRRARAGICTTVCYANAHTINLAWRDARYFQTLASCDWLFADGQSVVWASRGRTPSLPERMTAADYFPKLARRCAADGVRLYLLGGAPGVVDRAVQRQRAAWPGLQIVGAHHGYFHPDESERRIAEINTVRPDLLLVGMASPRQESWLAEHRRALDVPVRWCVGALFDYLAGVEARAPRWLCRVGGEWLFRLAVDPAGKWRRYLIGNPRFVWNAVRWRLFGVRPHAGESATMPGGTAA